MKQGLILLIMTWTMLCAAETLVIAVPVNLEKTAPFVELKTYVAEALAKEDIQIEYVPLSIDRSTFMVEKGELDGELVRESRVIRRSAKSIMTSFPIAHSDFIVVHRKQIKNFTEDKLSEYAGVMFYCAVVTRDALSKRNAKVVSVDSLEHALKLLENGRADYTILPEPIIDAAKIQYAKDFKNLVVRKNPLDHTDLYFYVRKNKSYLMPKVEKAFKKASNEPLEKYHYLPEYLNRKIP
ncbi:substrate-binding periplasmic protein [Bdellovibrio sp. HCB337]|uniref:substrate-binding periplasmic protein n=1 Tax=Bdellovibrio sp. HCB337 TaxID=3394358 RepID=UPI0039A714D3